MTEYLNACGYQINRKRVSRLMGELGLRAIYPGPKLSAPGKDSKKHPYLLRDLEVARPNQVWPTNITYIRMPGVFNMDRGVQYTSDRFATALET
jgi:putative transposase